MARYKLPFFLYHQFSSIPRLIVDYFFPAELKTTVTVDIPASGRYIREVFSKSNCWNNYMKMHTWSMYFCVFLAEKYNLRGRNVHSDGIFHYYSTAVIIHLDKEYSRNLASILKIKITTFWLTSGKLASYLIKCRAFNSKISDCKSWIKRFLNPNLDWDYILVHDLEFEFSE